MTLHILYMVNFITLDFTIQTFPLLHRYYNRYMYMSLVQYMYMYIVYVPPTCAGVGVFRGFITPVFTYCLVLS